MDINTIFPLFLADPDDPRNYLFEKTDDYLAPIIKNKSDIVYRLGQSIEHFSNYYINPPKDYEKWAKICINIIRHYNEAGQMVFITISNTGKYGMNLKLEVMQQRRDLCGQVQWKNIIRISALILLILKD